MTNDYNLTYNDKKFIIEEFYNEIILGCAICKDFNITYEKFFKYDFLIQWAYELEESKKLYTEDFKMQKCYNDFYKNYGYKALQLNKFMKQLVYNIKQIIIDICGIFNYNISKKLENKEVL